MTATPVTIGVTTYNSGKYVVETLESILTQTYQNLELVISDDASSDNTLQQIEGWINKPEKRKRFNRIKLIKVPQNTGVSANCNRVIKAATSEWIKFIAGDDILLSNCIEDNMVFILKYPEAKIVFSAVSLYSNRFSTSSFIKTVPNIYPNNLMNSQYTAQDQFELLLLSDRINYTPSYFFNKKAVVDVGGYDEKNSRIEDYPMWLKLTRAGYRLFYFHKPTVGYRQHNEALNNRKWHGTVRSDYKLIYEMRKREAHPYLPWELVGKEQFIFLASSLFAFLHLGSRKGLSKKIHHIVSVYLNPFTYIYYIKKKLKRRSDQSQFYTDIQTSSNIG